MARRGPRKSRAFCICPSIRCRPCIRAGKCGRTSAIRLATTRWRWQSAPPTIRSAIMACAGIIPARTASMRRSAGRTRRDAVPDTALRQGRQHPSQLPDSTLEAVLRRDRWVVGGAIGIIVALAWGYVLWLANDMDMGGMDMTGFRMIPAGIGIMLPASEPWQAIEFAYVFLMWAVMMVGMMSPSAAPMILMYARVGRHGKAQGKPFAATGWFAAGYLLAWSGFSLAATFLQWVIERAALLDTRMAIASNLLGAIVLIAAGVYQWTPLKDVCLAQCQTPFQFLMRHGGFRNHLRGCLHCMCGRGRLAARVLAAVMSNLLDVHFDLPSATPQV